MAVQKAQCTAEECLASPINLKGWMKLRFGSLRGEESSSDLSTSCLGERKIHEHPEGLGEVHLFPDITK